MKKELAFFTVVLVLVSLLAGIPGCTNSRSPQNAQFTIQVSGLPGTEFTGSCTSEVKYTKGSRTEETDIQGTMTADKTTFEFTVPGTEISCKISPKSPDNPVTVVLLKNGTEVKRVENIGYDSYISWYPPVIIDTAKAPPGYRYEPNDYDNSLTEIVESTEAETTKISELTKKLPLEVTQQFTSKYEAWQITWDDPKYAMMSSPYWTTVDEYKQLVTFCRAQGKKVWPLLFQELISADRQFIVESAIIDATRPDCEPILEKIRQENLHEHYTNDGRYIMIYSSATMKLAKELLASL